MSYDLTGKVKVIGEVQTFESGFQKRELVVTVEDGKFPQDINIEFVKDKIDLLDPLNIGDEVCVSFNLSGREYKGKYYNSLQGWKVKSLSSAGTTAPPVQDFSTENAPDFDEYQDNIPF